MTATTTEGSPLVTVQARGASTSAPAVRFTGANPLSQVSSSMA